ncbi:hypothetical protein HZQ79_08070 [Elizabethkingia anophelis]|nr:hypothetical protein [Elizabethkingia anophelis]
MYNKENNIGSLYQISGRNAVGQSFRADRQHSEMQTILQARLLDCKKAGKQKSKRDRLTAGKHTRQIS